MIRVFLTYTINDKVDRVRAEKNTEIETNKVLLSVLNNIAKSNRVKHWLISSHPVKAIDSYDLVN